MSSLFQIWLEQQGLENKQTEYQNTRTIHQSVPGKQDHRYSAETTKDFLKSSISSKVLFLLNVNSSTDSTHNWKLLTM